MIEVRECSKAFGSVKAVNKATLDIGDRGGILALWEARGRKKHAAFG